MTFPRTRRQAADGTERGFTLVEMLIVVALVGILASMALPSYRTATIKAKEAVLRHDLWVMRDVIDQFFTDKTRYPQSLDELVSSGYLRVVPVDPFTKSNSTWQTKTEPLNQDDQQQDEDTQQPGITDVTSGAAGTSLDGTPYSEW